MKYRASLLWILYVVACFGLAIWFNPAQTSGPLGFAQEQSWSLPAPAERKVADAYRYLLRRQPWGRSEGGLSASGKKEVGAKWSLVGIVRQGGVDYALVDHSGQLKQYRVGDVIAGGTQLTAIDRSEITVSLGGVMKVIRLYQKQ